MTWGHVGGQRQVLYLGVLGNLIVDLTPRNKAWHPMWVTAAGDLLHGGASKNSCEQAQHYIVDYAREAVAIAVEELQMETDVKRQLQQARADAKILAHSYKHDSNPPADVVARALAYPVRG